MPSAPLAAFIVWLRERHQAIMNCEKEALSALYDDKDEFSYRELMLEKAETIAALDSAGIDLVAALPDEELRENAATALRSFANGARNALRLDSMFYMSTILYPDEHKPGEPDNLQRLIAELERIG